MTALHRCRFCGLPIVRRAVGDWYAVRQSTTAPPSCPALGWHGPHEPEENDG